ncbi:MAG TPA: pyrroloquinoline quinone biosynthesis protein PqqB [Nitrospira sp.]
MLLRILGSAAGGGFPQWNCACDNCHGIRTRSIHAMRRTQESACLTANGTDYVLINASPDIRAQIEQCSALHPRAPRDSPIAAIVLTNGDVDHCVGLFSLREWQPLAVYATTSVWHDLIERNVLCRTLDRYAGHLTWRELTLDSPQELQSASGISLGLMMETVAAPGKVPLHLEGIAPPDAGQNIGLVLHVDSSTDCSPARLAYFPSVGQITETIHQTLAQADVVVWDGTFWSNDELIRQGLAQRSAEEMAHVPISGENGSLAGLSDLAARRVLTHINNSNPILRDDSRERGSVAAAGWDVAYDGMELKL